MKYYLLALGIPSLLGLPVSAMAWDGFDAATADLVEIIPDKIPKPGDTVEIRFYENESSLNCQVESIIRNRKTIEVMVREPGGGTRILVMEGK